MQWAAALPPCHQAITVTGKVSDAKGEPLAGVSVTTKSNNLGTATRSDGSFSIDAPSNSTLIFSFVGYATREISVNGRASINVVLEASASSLEQVVIVGYGTQKKANLTGAVSQVSSEVLDNRSLPNLTQGLQGVVPNLNITMLDVNNASFNAFGANKQSTDVIDHIFTTGDFTISKWGILTDTYFGKFPSDHFPVLADLSLK